MPILKIPREWNCCLQCGQAFAAGDETIACGGRECGAVYHFNCYPDIDDLDCINPTCPNSSLQREEYDDIAEAELAAVFAELTAENPNALPTGHGVYKHAATSSYGSAFDRLMRESRAEGRVQRWRGQGTGMLQTHTHNPYVRDKLAERVAAAIVDVIAGIDGKPEGSATEHEAIALNDNGHRAEIIAALNALCANPSRATYAPIWAWQRFLLQAYQYKSSRIGAQLQAIIAKIPGTLGDGLTWNNSELQKYFSALLQERQTQPLGIVPERELPKRSKCFKVTWGIIGALDIIALVLMGVLTVSVDEPYAVALPTPSSGAPPVGPTPPGETIKVAIKLITFICRQIGGGWLGVIIALLAVLLLISIVLMIFGSFRRLVFVLRKHCSSCGKIRRFCKDNCSCCCCCCSNKDPETAPLVQR